MGRLGGKVVKNLGDSFMLLFQSATEAVRASLTLLEQNEQDLQDDSAINDERRVNRVNLKGFQLRVSIATGDVEEISGDYFGDVVNLSARILSVTPAGQVWISKTTCSL